MVKDYTISALLLVLNDMLGNKLPLIKDLHSFMLYGQSLVEKRDLLSGLRKAVGETPLVQAVEAANERFKSATRAFYFVSSGLAQFVDLPKETRDFLGEAQKTMIPSLGVVKESYKVKAASVEAVQQDLDAFKAGLEAFPIGPNMSLYTLAAAHVDAGRKLDALLSSRADVTVDEELKHTKEMQALRSKTLGLINKFREALIQEVKVNAALPRDLEARVFAYYDQLGDPRINKETDDETDEESETETPAPAAANA